MRDERCTSENWIRTTRRRAVWWQVLRLMWVAVLSVAIGPSAATAQSVANATIRGSVTDDTGGALPGVTVSASSPALLVAQVVAVTGADGAYALPDLPIGSYKVAYELSGFRRFVRDEIRLTAGFTSEINVTLAVGSVEETLTVVGASPVVDTSSTTPSVSLSSQYLTEVLPGTRRLNDILATTPGMTTRFPGDLAGGTSGGGAYRNYGVTGQATMLFDGVNTRQDANTDQGTGNGPDMGALEEMQIVTVGGSAEQGTPGVFVNMIVKSGGNNFHGRYEGTAVHKKLQDNNITPELRAQGVSFGDAFNYSGEASGDLGGRIIQDKLWFYGAVRYRKAEKLALGFAKAPGPDGTWATADDDPATVNTVDKNYTTKVTYQASSKYKLVGLYATRREDFDPFPPNSPPRLNPYPTTSLFKWYPRQLKAEIQGTPSSRFLFNVLLAHQDNRYWLDPQPPSGPRQTDIFTGLVLGGVKPNAVLRESWGPSGSASFFPPATRLGTHELKVGGSLMLQYVINQNTDAPNGNYSLTFDTGRPLQLLTYNYPFAARNNLNESGLFAQDTWRVGKQTTLNLGLRYDQFHAYVPAQTKTQGAFGSAGNYPELDVITWREMAPRLGVSYDLTGSGKTVLKAMWGRYNHSPGDSFAGVHNQNALVTTTYRWSDPNGNGDYDPGEVNLGTTALNPDFVTIAGAANFLENPELEGPRAYETVLSVERELVPDFGARFSYIYLRQSRLYSSVNVRRPYGVYDVVLPRQDPGIDGTLGTADDGGIVNVYDYPAAVRGSAFVANQRVNRPSDLDPKLHTIEAVFTRRTTGRWGMLGSISAAKNDSYLDGIITTPNQDYFPKDTTWDWEAKASGSYDLPYQIVLSGTYQLLNGIKGARTNVFRNIPSASTVTLRLEPYGAYQGPMRRLLNLRAGRVFSVGSGARLKLGVDLLNALNTASPWTLTTASGPSFMYWGTIDSPRLLRGSVSLTF